MINPSLTLTALPAADSASLAKSFAAERGRPVPVPSHAADPAALDKSFETLRIYDYGSDRGALMPVDNAVRAALGDLKALKALESRLLAALQENGSAVAREYICGKLALIGAAASVPALADLLSDHDLALAARGALAAMTCQEAAAALRASLGKLSGLAKAGVIDALSARGDLLSVPLLIPLLADPDRQIASAAMAALGQIGTVEAARALQKLQGQSPEPPGLADACLHCAERLSEAGHQAEAQALYQSLLKGQHPVHLQAAAKRGLTAHGNKPL